FAAGTVYTATVTLTPKAGFTLTGVAENFFTVAGGTSTNAANSGLVSIVFAATAEPVTAIGAITGIPMSGQTLTAGEITPVGATVDYRWQVSNDGVNAWLDISGAVTASYEVDPAKSAAGQYVRLVATGNGSYCGEVFSAAEKILGMPTMVSVTAGTFQRDATAANTSFVSAFSMSAHEITRAQFNVIMGTDPSNTSYSNGVSDPVQMANWYHAIAFCNKLSIAEGLTPVYTISGSTDPSVWGAVPTSDNPTWNAATCNWAADGYRLPTEMEWMWAAMGADTGNPGATNTTGYNKAYAGEGMGGAVGDYAWYFDNASSKTHPAGTKQANELGISDMSGNAWEFCWDWYNIYPENSNSDYRGAGTGSDRVMRGGSWAFAADKATVAFRNRSSPNYQGNGFGFRVVRSVIVPVTEIGGITGLPKSGQTLTAGALTPSYAAVTYQWQVSDDGSAGWADIAGVTTNTYVVDLAKTASGKYVRVAAAGKDSYSGTVYSSAKQIWGDYSSATIGTLKYVPAGSFQRDSDEANISIITKGFRMSQHEITRTQFSAIMGSDPSVTETSNGVTDPVQFTNWYCAIAFCNKLSIAEGLTPVYEVNSVDFSTLTYAAIPTTTNTDWDAATCNWSANGYRLPTEMEWMWAAMGADQDSQPGAVSGGVNLTGYAKPFAGSNSSNTVGDYAWSSDNSSFKTHPVGTKLANELGLYDMSGNVFEWCWDFFENYPSNTVYDYHGALTGSSGRVCRGGSGGSNPSYFPSRYSAGMASASNWKGFRVVRP
ncbi:MAG: hypothetical protein CVV42_08165, partial [Candidatus Riflebacteria bacterium HGW-Riflebacteria-2]